MKFIGKLIIWLLIALLLIILAFYFLLQTRWGARQISQWASDNTNYQIAFEAMDHRFSSPFHLLLKNVTFGRDGQPPTLVARTVDIGFSTRQLTDPLHVDTIELQEGTLNLSPSTAPFPIEADRLQLTNMALHSPETGWDLSAQRVTGGVVPWHPLPDNVLGTQSQIQMSAGSLTLNGIPATNVLVQGNIDHGVITLGTIGADVARGSLSGNARRNADGSWQIDALQLSDIRLQSEKTLPDFFATLTAVPSLSIGRLEVTDARLQGPDWAVTDLDMSLRNLTFIEGGWQSDEGRLSMNASEFIYGSLHLLDPILNAEFSPQGIALRQFTSRWEGGMVRTSGNWLRNGQALILDDTAIAGLEYTLPLNWKQQWVAPLPDWLQNVTLRRFTANRNLIIDIDPAWPWQITALDGYADNLQLAKDGRWGVWGGNAALNGADATFSRVDVRRPSLKLVASASAINITELSAFTEKGILEATASISQQPTHQLSLRLNGRGVPLQIMQQWGWPELPIGGDGNLQLTASGNLQPDVPLKPTVNGKLHAVNMDKQEVTQTMSGGQVTTIQPTPLVPSSLTPTEPAPLTPPPAQ